MASLNGVKTLSSLVELYSYADERLRKNRGTNEKLLYIADRQNIFKFSHTIN